MPFYKNVYLDTLLIITKYKKKREEKNFLFFWICLEKRELISKLENLID